MGKNKWMHRNPQQPSAAPPIGPDAPTVDLGDSLAPESTDGICTGQIWDGVIVPDRTVNVMALTPGAKLGALLVEGPFDDGTGHWCASFVGEAMTKLRVDAEMLKTGKMRI
jgi:hypothetical protein